MLSKIITNKCCLYIGELINRKVFYSHEKQVIII